MKKKFFLILFTVFLFANALQAQVTGTFKDTRDGKIYKTVKIGSQTWMTVNLDISKFRTGDAIAEAKTNAEWQKAGKQGTPAWCFYDNDPANGIKYGKLYNWYARNDSRGLAPQGWHIPTDAEWRVLTTYLGGADSAAIKMKATDGWVSTTHRGTNSSGFTALPGGYRDDEGPYKNLVYGAWLASAADQTGLIRFRIISHDSDELDSYYYVEASGFYVRCLKD